MTAETDAAYQEGYEDGCDEAQCYSTHCDDYDCKCTNRALEELVASYLRKLRMGYTINVTLQDVLEEMERTIR